MPASTIAAVLLRLFALNFVLKGTLEVIGAFAFTGGWASGGIQPAAIGVIQIIFGIVFWWTAPRFSRFLAGRSEDPVQLMGVTEEQLYATTFLGVGLWFALSSFAGVFNWIHYFAVNRPSEQDSSTGEEANVYAFMESLFPLAAGLVLIFTCKTWAAKVTHRRTGRIELITQDIG